MVAQELIKEKYTKREHKNILRKYLEVWKKKSYLCSPLNEGAQKSKFFFERDTLSQANIINSATDGLEKKYQKKFC